MDKLLKLLDTNARLTNAQLAVMLDTTEESVRAQIAGLEKSGVIRAYKALIDWDRTDREYVTAIIELRVTPKRDLGFEGIAETIMRFEEVESVYLMSGGYDLSVVVTAAPSRRWRCLSPNGSPLSIRSFPLPPTLCCAVTRRRASFS